jgi:hypothetical protein
MTRPYLAVIFCAFCQLATAEPAKRTFTVVDSSGTETEVSDLKFVNKNENFARFRVFDPRVVVLTPTFQIAIPMGALIGVQKKDKENFEVTYVRGGQERVITGTLEPGSFRGESGFGMLDLSTEHLKQVKSKSPPVTETAEKAPPLDASLILRDGTEVQVGNLKRMDSYYSSKGYILGGAVRYEQHKDFRLLRGESLSIAEFRSISAIDFEENGMVTVKLKNGNTATGKLSTAEDAGVDGFTGINESGEFFIDPKLVKGIRVFAVQADDRLKAENKKVDRPKPPPLVPRPRPK